MFERYSEQRGFAGELQEAVKTMGFDTTDPAGLGGVLHGAWMTLKGTLTAHNEHAIVVETARGEDWSLKTYREALDKTLPVAIRSIVEQQFEQVRQAHEHITLLRDATTPKRTTPEQPTRVS